MSLVWVDVRSVVTPSVNAWVAASVVPAAARDSRRRPWVSGSPVPRAPS